MAGLNPAEVERALGFWRRSGGRKTIILVEHVMQAVMKISERLVVLNHGEDCRGKAGRSGPEPGSHQAYLEGRMLEVKESRFFTEMCRSCAECFPFGGEGEIITVIGPQRRGQDQPALKRSSAFCAGQKGKAGENILLGTDLAALPRKRSSARNRHRSEGARFSPT